jgi:hypothetical protein
VNGAVTATSGASFTSGQSVSRNVVHVDQREIVSTQAAAPAIAPTRQAFVGAGVATRVRPPAAMASRPVVAKATPPPPPASFDRQAAAIRENGGRPLGVTQYHQLQPVNAQASARANIRVAPPARTVTAIQPKGTTTVKGVQPPVNANRPNNTSGNTPGNVPANNQRAYSDRPATARPPAVNAPVNPAVEQQHQQQLENLRKQQDVERQKVEQQQVKEQQRVQAVNDQQKQAQVQQKQQQQLEELEKKHDSQQKQLQQKQNNDKPPAKGAKPEKEKDNKPPK